MNTAEEKGLELAGKAGTYSTVTVTNHDTVGATFLGVLAVILLGAFLVSQRRLREMAKQRAKVRVLETK